MIASQKGKTVEFPKYGDNWLTSKPLDTEGEFVQRRRSDLQVSFNRRIMLTLSVFNTFLYQIYFRNLLHLNPFLARHKVLIDFLQVIYIARKENGLIVPILTACPPWY